jgi:hypothetical protein
MDAEPDVILRMPEDSLQPLISALAVTAVFAGLLMHIWTLVIIGGAISLVSGIAWLWPHRYLVQTQSEAAP